MSNQSKIITVGILIAFGIGNGECALPQKALMDVNSPTAYYTFNPSFKELKEQKEGSSIR
ncbi:hypothetical protein B0I37DRAFT_376277 [Chaetomium sp. MPI-CAGE-AT-0009]|nr:hypothetical protein B0I37DRAFT_376277 [Chaetomium sp. MPI-CAGE-AT-0009]